jgi:outer membrane autotransporter protein
MKKTVRNAVLAAMVLTTVCGGAQMAWASSQVYVTSGNVTEDLSNISVDDDLFSVLADGGTLSSNTEEINITNSYFDDDNYAIVAQDSGKINLGDENVTKSINVTVKGAKPTGLISFYHYGAKINVAGDNFNVNVHGVDTAYGIWVQSNIPTEDKDPIPAEVNINAKNTVIDVSTDVDKVDDAGEHTAIGIVAYSGSKLNINNNLTVNAATAISTRGNSTININKDGTGTVKLNGDISFNYYNTTGVDSTVNLNLTNNESYLNGNIIKTGKIPEGMSTVRDMDMSISNGATWTSTADSFVNNLTLKNGGTVNLAGNAHSVEVLDSTSSNNGVVATNSLDSKVKLEGTKNIKSLTVKGTGAMADAIAKDSSVAAKLANVVTDESTGKSAATNITTDEGEVAGAYSGTVSGDGTVSGSIAKNTTNENISGLGVISLMTWRQENNDLNKRLGELRDSKGQYGLWTRMSRGEAKYNDLGIKNQYNYYQLGYDAKISDDWILGGAVSYTDGESSFRDGDGTNKHTGFAVYGSRLGDDGSFIDVIAKYAHMKNEYDTYAGAGDGDYSTNGFAFSAEYGKRFKGQNDFWIEPQAELTYGRVDSADFTTAKGVHVRQDSLDSLVGRLGFALGKDIKAGHVYVRASYLYDFKGDVNMYMDKNGVSDSYDHDLGGGWWEFGVGTNLNLGHDTHFYFDVERTASGEVSTPWQWNAGIRYSF